MKTESGGVRDSRSREFTKAAPIMGRSKLRLVENPEGSVTVPRYELRRVRIGTARYSATRVGCMVDLASLVVPILVPLVGESILVVPLDGRNNVRGVYEVSRGGLHGAALTPIDVLRVVIAENVNAFAMAHNHPSGDPTPSADDIAMTQHLVDAMKPIGVTMIDHLVVAGDEERSRVVSFRDQNLGGLE